MNLKMLDVVIGVIFFYTFASLICTTVRELVETLLASRAKMLEQALREILDDKTPGKADSAKGVLVKFYEHPLIDSLFPGEYSSPVVGKWRVVNWFRGLVSGVFGNRNLPAYIPSDHFASALIDIVAASVPNGADGSKDKKAILNALRAGAIGATPTLAGAAPGETPASANGDRSPISSEKLRTAVRWAVENAEGDLDKAKRNLERWFDNSMERVTGWYKKNTQRWLLFIGALVAVGLNMNSLEVVRALYVDDEMRDAIIAVATRTAADPAIAAKARGPQPAAPEPAKDPAHTAPKSAAKAATAPPEPIRTSAAESAPEAAGPAAPIPPADSEEAIQKKIDAAAREVEQLKGVLNVAGFPIGWTAKSWKALEAAALSANRTEEQIALLSSSLAGWALTAIAMTLGASFWFDLLNKLVSLRSSLKPQTAEERARQKP